MVLILGNAVEIEKLARQQCVLTFQWMIDILSNGVLKSQFLGLVSRDAVC